MSKSFAVSKNAYRVTLLVDPEKSPRLIRAATALGALQVFVVKSRGVLHKKKWGFLTLPGISPSFDVIHLIVEKPYLIQVMDTLVKVGELQYFGAGAIFATRLTELITSGAPLFQGARKPTAAKSVFDYQKNLVAVSCICQFDHAEEIARRAMEAGSPSPSISYGYGHGIRDRLGFFLQLTINPKKELIDLVVGSAEAERIFETMVEAGHLDEPAQGFIHTTPVEMGLINTMSYQNTSPYPATMEQIIKAIDKMQGNHHWRQSGTVQRAPQMNRKKLKNLVNLTCILKRGFGDLCSLAAMEAGAGGTTAVFANAFPIPEHKGHPFEGSDEREMVSLTVPQAQVATVVKAIGRKSELEGSPVILFTNPAPESLTYLSQTPKI